MYALMVTILLHNWKGDKFLLAMSINHGYMGIDIVITLILSSSLN